MTKIKKIGILGFFLLSLFYVTTASAFIYKCESNSRIDACLTNTSVSGSDACAQFKACQSQSDAQVFEGAQGEEGTTLKDCDKLPIKLAEINLCPLCPLFETILKTDQTMATKSYEALAQPFMNVTVMVMALYIAFQTLLTVSAFTKQDAPKYITTLLVQAFKVLVVIIILSDSKHIYDNVITPLMKGGLEFGLALLFDESALTSFGTYKTTATASFSSGAIDTEVLGSVVAAVKVLTEKAAELPAIGGSLICVSVNAASPFPGFPHLGMFIEGLVVYAFGWAIVLAAAFYLLDSAVRFGIFCTLIPFLTACWPFKITRSYTKTGWDIFINCIFNFIMMGLVISLSLEMVQQALGGGSQELQDAINGDEVDKLKEAMDMGGMQFLILVACCLYAFKLVGQINALASEISSTSGGTSIGGKMGSLVGEAAKKAATTAGKTGMAVGKAALSKPQTISLGENGGSGGGSDGAGDSGGSDNTDGGSGGGSGSAGGSGGQTADTGGGTGGGSGGGTSGTGSNAGSGGTSGTGSGGSGNSGSSGSTGSTTGGSGSRGG